MTELPRVITLAGAQRIGFTDGRIRTQLRQGHWRRMTSGIFLTRPEAPDRSDWVDAGMALGGPEAVLSGWDAVRQYGVGPARPPDAGVLVLVGSGKNRLTGLVRVRPTRRPTRWTAMPARDRNRPDLRVAAPSRAVCDTALDCRQFAPVRAMVTGAVQKGLCTPDDLAAEYGDGPRNGSGFLFKALADVLGGAQSIAEAEAIEYLRAADVAPFEVNAAIYGTGGRLLYVVDVLWRDLRAILEIDSREFHFTEQDWKATSARHNVLTAMDYAVVHYPPSAIRAGRVGWALEVRRWLDARARSLEARRVS